MTTHGYNFIHWIMKMCSKWITLSFLDQVMKRWFQEYCQANSSFNRQNLISYPDLFSTKPNARSDQIWFVHVIACQEWEKLKKGEGLKKSFKMAAVLQNELIELSAKLPLTKRSYTVAQLKYQDQLIDWLIVVVFGNIKFKVGVRLNLHVIVTVWDQSRQKQPVYLNFYLTIFFNMISF